jgi:hypothetical protein
MRESVERCSLDLRGTMVFTEAATGAYAATPVLAALAGAERIIALTHSSRHGSVETVRELTQDLATRAGVAGRIEVVTEKREEHIRQADVVTNCGHVRAIDREMVSWMRPKTVIPLMYESWELRPGEVDLDACRERGVRVAGTNERHPNVDVFSYLGPMAVRLLSDAGIPAYRSHVLVVCDNPFAPFIRSGLEVAGANVTVSPKLSPDLAALSDRCDAILVATEPQAGTVIGPEAARLIAVSAPSAVVVQFWGEIDRIALHAADVPCWPAVAPHVGHMGILPSALGPEPIVRLQTGGLKVAEVLLRSNPSADDWRYLEPIS